MQHCIEMYTEHGYGADSVAALCTVDDWYRFRFDSSKDEEACLYTVTHVSILVKEH